MAFNLEQASGTTGIFEVFARYKHEQETVGSILREPKL
jgi:hypothetical protein